MKRTLVSLLSLMALFTITSCQKEATGDGSQFHATMEPTADGKTVLSGTALNWVSGDRVAIYGTAGCGIYQATPQTPATVATLNNVEGSAGDGPFRAFYPASLTDDGATITLPSAQTYVENSINEFPMYAESATNQLAFKNLCGVLKLHLTKANTSITTISVTANAEICGDYTVSYVNDVPQLSYTGNGSNTVTMTCATAQAIDNGRDFYIYLPATFDSLKSITITTNDCRVCTKTVKASSHISIDRNTITDVALGENDLAFRPIGSKGGLFTINSRGDQVWFSQGNLQYQASTDTWRFAENQYDTIGRDNSNISAVYNGWVDLFGWGTGSNPTTSSINNSDYSTFVDWGINAISNGGNIENCGWRTLSLNEWLYLIGHATKATGNIEGINGIILLPTNWTLPNGCIVNSGMNGWSSNTYTISQWSKMENSGAVFLPVAGYRENTYVGNVNVWGDIWTSTMLNSTMARSINFGSSRISEDAPDHHRYYGFSVRLVRNN